MVLDHGRLDRIRFGVILTPDDGQYHGTFRTTGSISLYQALSGTVAIAPFLGRDSEPRLSTTLARGPGKGLNQYVLGFAVGASLDRIVPGTFVETYYDYVASSKRS